MGETLIKICIVEDNEYMREGWSTTLDDEPDLCVIGAYESCEDAFQSSEIGRANVALMDIELPGMSGIEGVRYLREKQPETNVIMATVFDDDRNIFDALCAGAVGYLTKKITPGELCNAIRDAYRGGSPMTPQIARKVIRSLHNTEESESKLSERELQILNQLSTGNSYKTIGEEIYLSVDGVRYHIRNIYRKLQVNNRSEAVAKGLRNRII